MKEILARKGTHSLSISFINDKVFYTKKNPKTQIKTIQKDLNSIRIYALNCIIKVVNDILFVNKNLILAKQEFFSKFLFDIKLKNTLKLYGENYKKINSFMGIENYSNRKKNILFVRETYKRYFQLQKVFLLCEKYNHGFSRYLNYVNNQVFVSQINKNKSGFIHNKNSLEANNPNNNNNLRASNIINNNSNGNSNSKSNSKNKLYRILNFTSTADSNYFDKKKAEAKNSCFASLYVNICFSKWKLLLYRSLNSKIDMYKNLNLFIQIMENVFIHKLNNAGKYFLMSNLHLENEKSNELNNKDKESESLLKTTVKQELPRDGSAVGYNSKKLIMIEEKIKINTKYNRFVYLTKQEFFQKLRREAHGKRLTENKISKNFNNLIFVAYNLLEYKIKVSKIEFFSALQNYVEMKTKKLRKQEALRSIIQLQRLSNSASSQIGHTKSIADFARKYYIKLRLRKNLLQKYFSTWKYALIKFLNKVKIQEKFDYAKYRDELSPGIYENNKLFAEKLELIKQSKLKSNKNQSKKNVLQYYNISADAKKEEEEDYLIENSEAVSLGNNTNYLRTNKQINEEFGEKVINFTNNEFEIFFFKILAESKSIPKSKLMFFLRTKIFELHKKNLNYFFKKFRLKLNLYFPYNKILAALYSNKNLNAASGVIKDEAYFLGLHSGKRVVPSLPEQLENKIRITAPAKQPKFTESPVKIASISHKLSLQRIDYLINQNQSKIILDYEQDEMRLDKDINFCKKLISGKSYMKLARIFIIVNKIKLFEKCFSKWKNAAFFPVKHYYSNILEKFENVRSENEIIVNTLNKAKSDYKKLVQDYKTLKNYFCENCMNCGEEFVLDEKSVKSDNSNNINASDLKGDSNYNSENFSLNRRISINDFFSFFDFLMKIN